MVDTCNIVDCLDKAFVVDMVPFDPEVGFDGRTIVETFDTKDFEHYHRCEEVGFEGDTSADVGFVVDTFADVGFVVGTSA